MVLKEQILNRFYFEKVHGGLERTDFEQFLGFSLEGVSTLGGVVVLKELLFEQFLLWECVVVLKELILNSFYFGRVWWFERLGVGWS